MAIEYNEFVAQATNRQSAINILRARDREPLHFTSFTKVLGQARVEGAAELGAALNGDFEEGLPTKDAFTTTKKTLAATNWSPKLSVKVNSGTDFEIAINATDDFWKGIIGPVAPATLVYYLNQDWPPDLLSHLFISRIELIAVIKDTTDAKRQFEAITLDSRLNMPEEKTEGPRFTEALRCRDLSYKLDPKPSRSLPVPTIADLSGVEADVLAKLKLHKKDDDSKKDASAPSANVGATRQDPDPSPAFDYSIGEKNDFRLALSQPLDPAACKAVEDALVQQFDLLKPTGLAPSDPTKILPKTLRRVGAFKLAGGGYLTVDTPSEIGAFGNAGAVFEYPDYFTARLPEGFKGDLSIAITLRSIEGVIHYLGEYLRHPERSPKLASSVCPAEQPYCLPIIKIVPATGVKNDAFIAVEFKGQNYIVPSSGIDLGPDAGRSSQVITLVQQMLNLHRSAKDLPSTPLVRVLN